MADNSRASAGTNDGEIFATDDIGGGIKCPRAKVVWGPDGTINDTDIATGKPLPTQIRSSTGTELATAGAPLRIDPTGTTTQPVSDAAGSLTVDAPVGTPVATRLSDGTSFLATTGGGLLRVDASGVAVAISAINTSVTPGTTAANLGKAEGAATASGDTGVMALVKCQTTDGLSTGVVNGDYCAPQVDGNGYLKVNIKAGAGSGGTASTDEAAYTPTTSTGTPIMGAADETAPDAAAEGTLAIIRSTLNRALHVNLRDAAGAELTVSNWVQYAGGSVAGATDMLSMSGAVMQTTAGPLTGVVSGDVTALQTDANGALRVTGGTAGTEYDRGTASTATDKMTMAGVVRQNSPSSLVNNNGDRTCLIVDDIGRLHTIPTASIVDNTAFSLQNTMVRTVGFLYDDTVGSGSDVTENFVAAGRIDSKRALVSTIEDATTRGQRVAVTARKALLTEGVNRTASGALGAANNAVTLSAEGSGIVHWEIDTGTLVGTVVFEATLDDTNWFAINAIRINGTIIASTATFADRGALDCAGYSQVRMRVSAYTSGTSNGRLEASSGSGVVRLGQALPTGANVIGALASNQSVNAAQINGVTPLMGNGVTGTGSQRVTIASDNTAFSVNSTSTGSVAHGATDSGNPVKVGYKAIDHGAAPTAVSANQRTDAYANRHGVPFTIGGHPNIQCIRATYTTAPSNNAIVTQAAGGKIVVTRVSFAISKNMTTNPSVIIGFATATTPTTTGVVASHPGLDAGGGMTTGDGSGILGIGADDEDLRITTGTLTTGTLDVVVTYYVVPA